MDTEEEINNAAEKIMRYNGKAPTINYQDRC